MAWKLPQPQEHGAKSDANMPKKSPRTKKTDMRPRKHTGRKRRAGSKACPGCEYCNPAGDPRSNLGKARRALRKREMSEALSSVGEKDP